MKKIIPLLIASFLFAITANCQKIQAFITSTNVKCNGDSTGTAIVTAINGIGSYTYLWEPG
jgi:hypothetical protein